MKLTNWDEVSQLNRLCCSIFPGHEAGRVDGFEWDLQLADLASYIIKWSSGRTSARRDHFQNVKTIFSPVCLRVCLFSPPGLPDVAGPEKPGVPDERALHHPRERRPALAPPRPAQRPRLPRRQRAALRRRAGGGALLGAGGGARDPQREGQRALRTGGVWTAASETKIKEAQIKISEETF